jgi:uncharacterized SAM-binding protein YcdF (DUF218 family)
VSPKLKRRLRLAAVALGLMLLAVPVSWVAGIRWLTVDSGPAAVQAVIVLGGESWTRPQRAAEVYGEARPVWVIVSGQGDCQDVRRQLEARDVPAEKILTECRSKSTHENAQFTVAILRSNHVTNAVVVTSWYHSRRALACFHSAAPEIHFTSRPTQRAATASWWPDRYERNRITAEHLKLLYYWVVYGVPPWR